MTSQKFKRELAKQNCFCSSVTKINKPFEGYKIKYYFSVTEYGKTQKSQTFVRQFEGDLELIGKKYFHL
jgi:hypothetical protein